MDASEVDTIKDILQEYEIDAFLDPKEFEKLVDALKNRENVMISDGLDQFKRALSRKIDRITKMY